jgi:hypothetical protein
MIRDDTRRALWLSWREYTPNLSTAERFVHPCIPPAVITDHTPSVMGCVQSPTKHSRVTP